MVFLKRWLVMVAICCSLVFNKNCAHDIISHDQNSYSIENVFDGIQDFYDSLTKKEQEDIAVLLDQLLEIGSEIQLFCDTYGKHNRLMLKYKEYKKTDIFNLNVAFGCTKASSDPLIYRDIELLNNFDYDAALQNTDLRDFYSVLIDEEQQELKVVLIEMLSFCKKIVSDLETLCNNYPTIKGKLEHFMQKTDQEFLISIGFDYPFPALVYKIA